MTATNKEESITYTDNSTPAFMNLSVNVFVLYENFTVTVFLSRYKIGVKVQEEYYQSDLYISPDLLYQIYNQTSAQRLQRISLVGVRFSASNGLSISLLYINLEDQKHTIELRVITLALKEITSYLTERFIKTLCILNALKTFNFRLRGKECVV